MDRLHDKLDNVIADLTEIKVILGKNTVILDRNVEDVAEHIKRTDLLEKQVQKALWPGKFVAGIGAIIVFVPSIVVILQVLHWLPR